jgi:hypothetical protein
MDEMMFLTAVAAIAAAVAAIASLYQVRSAANSNEITAYLQLMQEYGSIETKHAVSRLAEFWRDRRTRFNDAGAALLAESDQALVETLKADCRRVTNFFGNAARLYKAKLISKRLLETLISRPGLNVYYDVCEPMNVARNPRGHSAEYGVILREVVSNYADGTY